MRWPFRRRPKWKACVPISCPPAEKVEISYSVIRCPYCDAIPYSVPSMWETHDRYDWFCCEHGLVLVAERLADGRIEMTPQMREQP